MLPRGSESMKRCLALPRGSGISTGVIAHSSEKVCERGAMEADYVMDVFFDRHWSSESTAIAGNYLEVCVSGRGATTW